MNPESHTCGYEDVSKNYEYYSDLAYLTARGAVWGDEENKFRPHEELTRKTAAVILYNLLRPAWIDENTFSDVTDNRGEIASVAVGWITGYSDGTFRPDEPLTRGELATIICRALGRDCSCDVESKFTDLSGHWAEKYAAEISAEHVCKVN